MSNNFICIANNRSIFRTYISLYLFMLLILVAYNLIRIALNKDFEWNYFIFIVLSIYFIWDLLTEKNVSAIEFNNNEHALVIIQKPIIGKSKSYALNYEQLEFEIVEINNTLRRMITGPKIITLHKEDKAFALSRSSGFNASEIAAIENNLIKIKADRPHDALSPRPVL